MLGAAFLAAGRADEGVAAVLIPAAAGFFGTVGTGLAVLVGVVAGTLTPLAPGEKGGGVEILVDEAEEAAFAVSVK